MVNNKEAAALVVITMVNGQELVLNMSDREVESLRLAMFSARNTGWFEIHDCFINLDNVTEIQFNN